MIAKTESRRDALFAAALGAGALALYAASLPPSFAFWDTGELQTVAAIFGIAHPPASPAFVLLGWTAVHVLPLGEPAWRVTLLCALAVSISVALLFRVARSCGVPPITSALVALGFAAASVPWRDATRTEVHDAALLFRVVALAFGLRYAATGFRRDLFCLGVATGLAGSTHAIALLLVPSVTLLVAVRKESRSARALALFVAGIALGLLPYAYLPLRSAAIAARHLDPTVTLGLAPGAQPFWDYDHPASWRNFVRVVTAADFDVHSGFAGFLDVARFPGFAAALLNRLATAYGYAGAGFATFGAVLLVLRRPIAGSALLLAALLPVPYAEAYKELQDPDRYYLLTLWCAALAIGVGFEEIAVLFALRVRSIGRFVLAGVLVASFAAGSPERGSFLSQRYDRNAERYVDDIVATTPDNAIVVAEWAFATPLAYAAYVQHRLGRRIVLSAAPSQYAAHYRSWLAVRPLYVVTFNAALALAGFSAVPVTTSFYNTYAIALAAPRSTR